MQDEIEKDRGLETQNNFKRFVFLILVPLIVVMFTLGYFYSLGRYVTTENAYIKAPIVSIQSQIPGRVETVFVTDNQEIKKGHRSLRTLLNDMQFTLLPLWKLALL